MLGQLDVQQGEWLTRNFEGHLDLQHGEWLRGNCVGTFGCRGRVADRELWGKFGCTARRMVKRDLWWDN